MIDISVAPISTPPRCLPDTIPSGWRGLEHVLYPLLERFRVGRRAALEFGVEYGFSTVALSNYFDTVIGVDHFRGDAHAGETPEGTDRYHETLNRLAAYPNIRLMPFSWQEFCADAPPRARYDLVHVDALHDFYTTYVLSTWAAQHSDFVICHDTLYFPDVAPALDRVALDQGMTAYNYPHANGLGILVREAK